MLTDEQKEQLCVKVKAKAAEFAADPAKGRRAGYEPEQKWYRPVGETSGSLDTPARIALRPPETAWLYGVAGRDLAGREWRVIENPEGSDELFIV